MASSSASLARGADWAHGRLARLRAVARRREDGRPPARHAVPRRRPARSAARSRTKRVGGVLTLRRVPRCRSGPLAGGGDRLRLGRRAGAAARPDPRQRDPARGRAGSCRGASWSRLRAGAHSEGQGRRARTGRSADDVARVRATRAHLGPEGRIRVDANGGWNVDEAERAAHALAPFDLEYLEQPCATVPELAELRARLHDWQLPIAADESVRKADDPLAVARGGAADILVRQGAAARRRARGPADRGGGRAARRRVERPRHLGRPRDGRRTRGGPARARVRLRPRHRRPARRRRDRRSAAARSTAASRCAGSSPMRPCSSATPRPPTGTPGGVTGSSAATRLLARPRARVGVQALEEQVHDR